MVRWLIVGLLIAGLAIGVWALWPEGEPLPSTTTIAAIDTTSTSTLTTTSTAGSSSTTTPAHVVTTVEEAEAILAELWFGWFEGIYNEDEARIREVVGSEDALNRAEDQFGVMMFNAAPSPTGIRLSDVEVLESTEECLVVWAALDVSSFRPNTTGSEGVHVLRYAPDAWYLVSMWQNRNDLWNADCEPPFVPLS